MVIYLISGLLLLIFGVFLIQEYRYQRLCPIYEVIDIKDDSVLSLDKIDSTTETKRVYSVTFDVDGDLCEDILIITSTRINKSKPQYVFFDKVGNPQFVESYMLSIICTLICAMACFGIYIYNLL